MMLLRLSLLLFLSACAIGDDPNDDDTTDVDDDDVSNDDDSTDDDDSSGDDDDDSKQASVGGRVVDELGQPLEGLLLQICAGDCRSSEADVEGRFLFPGLPPTDWLLKSVSFPDPVGGGDFNVLDYSKIYEFVSVLPSSVAIDVGDVTPPSITDWRSPEDRDAGGGVEFFSGEHGALRISWPGELQAPSLAKHVPDDQLTVGVARLTESTWPSLDGGRVVIAAYSFAPWELALPDASASFEITWMPLEPLDSTLSYELQIADPALDQGTGEFRALDTLLDGPTGHLVASYPRLTKLLVVALD